MEFSAGEIAQLVGGEVEGDASVVVSHVAKIEEGAPGKLCFVASPKYEKFLYSTEASAIIVRKDLDLKEPITATLIRVDDPYASITLLLEKYERLVRQRSGIHKTAIISDSATIGEDVYIGPYTIVGDFATIGDGCQIHGQVMVEDQCSIGENSILYAGVKMYRDCIIGTNCIIHSGTVIGSDGFGFVPTPEGPFKKVPHVGIVKIGNWVEIGANCAIDRATMGQTVIEDGVKLDNLIQVAHNVVIGENTVMAGQAGVAGSTKIGKNCMIGGQAAIAGHIEIADGSRINGQSGVISTIKEGGKSWNGTPALPFRESYRMVAMLRKLPELQQRVKNLENKK